MPSQLPVELPLLRAQVAQFAFDVSVPLPQNLGPHFGVLANATNLVNDDSFDLTGRQ